MTKMKDRDEFARLWTQNLSLREIAAHYRATVGGIKCAAKRFGLPSRGRPRGGSNRVNPVAIRGVAYESQADAARGLGVNQATISKAKARGTLDRVGLRG